MIKDDSIYNDFKKIVKQLSFDKYEFYKMIL